jgi:hypothetical protein
LRTVASMMLSPILGITNSNLAMAQI